MSNNTNAITILVSDKLLRYLDAVIELEGYGDTREEVIERFVWDRIHTLRTAFPESTFEAAANVSEPKPYQGKNPPVKR